MTYSLLSRPGSSVLFSSKLVFNFLQRRINLALIGTKRFTNAPVLHKEHIQKSRRAWLYNLYNPIPYTIALQWQKNLRQVRIQSSFDPSIPDVLLLVEHPPVYTLGARTNRNYLKFDLNNPPCEVHQIERGGQVTYHGPGQLVGYPIFNLNFHKKDLRWYLNSVEQAIINTLERYNISAHRDKEHPGVWHGNVKLAAIGIATSKWVTMHGFALNVTTDLSAFEKIVPCGISDKQVGSMSQYCSNVNTNDVRSEIIYQFKEIFKLSFEEFEGEKSGFEDSTK